MWPPGRRAARGRGRLAGHRAGVHHPSRRRARRGQCPQDVQTHLHRGRGRGRGRLDTARAAHLLRQPDEPPWRQHRGGCPASSGTPPPGQPRSSTAGNCGPSSPPAPRSWTNSSQEASPSRRPGSRRGPAQASPDLRVSDQNHYLSPQPLAISRPGTPSRTVTTRRSPPIQIADSARGCQRRLNSPAADTRLRPRGCYGRRAQIRQFGAWLRCLRERVRVVTRRHTGCLFGLPPAECQGWRRSAAVPFEDRLPDNTDDCTPHGSHRIGRRNVSPNESRDHRSAKPVRARVGSQMFANWHD
jgi:hypothetical protein